jgi:TPR repeat protein
MPRAKYVMAVLLAQGYHMKRDPRTAYRLCQEAATSGEPDAQYMLGLMLDWNAPQILIHVLWLVP